MKDDVIYRQQAIDAVDSETVSTNPEHFKSNERFIEFMDDADIASFGKWKWVNGFNTALVTIMIQLKKLPSAQPESERYEYHYDHTDCIWYRPEARNRCPVTCSQYRDGWNDAMNYIFRDGKGYRPYRRGEQYEE